MTTETVYVVLMWMYPITLLGVSAALYLSPRKRSTYALLVAGPLLNFIGLIRYRVFHDYHGSFVLNAAAFPLMLAGGVSVLVRAFTRQGRHG